MKSIWTKSIGVGCLAALILLFSPPFLYADSDSDPASVRDEGPALVTAEADRSPDSGADPAAQKDEGQSSVTPDRGGETPREAPQEEFEEAKPIADPLEPVNRFIFGFNDKFYFWLMKPVAQGYSFVVPEFVRVRVRNAFENIKMPIRFVNSLLQLKIKAAGIELARFLMNSTIGFGGLFDLASRNPNLPAQDADFGQTLGVYGFAEGFYIMLPLLGPSSVRDGIGRGGDIFLNPVNYITPFFWDAFAVDAYDMVNRTSLMIGDYEDLKASAVDPYTSLKNFYIEHRRSKIKQ